jgi:KDO2-lipid IV(A) lauroyltransferase
VWLATLPAAWLPRSLVSAVGARGGALAFRALPRRREVALDNVRQAVANGALDPDTDPAAVARASFANLGRTALEVVRLWHRGLAAFEGTYETAGWDGLGPLIRELRAGGRPLLFLTTHSGNWELSNLAMTRTFGFTAASVGRTQGWLADAILRRIRTRDGNRLILKHEGAMTMLRHLKAGGILGTLFDQADIVGSNGASLMFMGRPALTTLGPLKLAARTGAAVVPYFSRRLGDRHVFEIAGPIAPPEGADRTWLLETAQHLNDLLGAFIRLHPDQWMWGHRRWKTPESRPDRPKAAGPGPSTDDRGP